jgi:Tol biopolymer transport system component
LNRVELGLINLAGEREVLRRQHGVSVEFRTWAPDGRRLYYLEQAHFTSAVASVGPSGGDPERIEIAIGVPGSLMMSPDGSTIAWGVQGSSDVVLQPVDGSAPKTYQIVPNAYLAWRPILGE